MHAVGRVGEALGCGVDYLEKKSVVVAPVEPKCVLAVPNPELIPEPISDGLKLIPKGLLTFPRNARSP